MAKHQFFLVVEMVELQLKHGTERLCGILYKVFFWGAFLDYFTAG